MKQKYIGNLKVITFTYVLWRKTHRLNIIKPLIHSVQYWIIIINSYIVEEVEEAEKNTRFVENVSQLCSDRLLLQSFKNIAKVTMKKLR